ncbi:MAG: tRNA lysidine(34) synthetase TilS [Bryobacteraceae bacterium]|jgi:tRNA(Ile)-lysidine synthase
MKSGTTVLQRIAQTIARHRMFEPAQQVGVAVSGGADSVCLLYVLLELAPRWGLHLSVLHLDHGLRGEESRQDAEFVRRLADQLGLPLSLRETPVAQSPDNLEQAARQARLAFFRETISSGAVQRIATGHTRSDQAETVLFRFLRGSGTAGLAGIRPVTSEGIVRPLIEIERSEVQQFLLQRGIAWREDSTNRGLQFARNRIRHELLPQIAREWNPAIGETLANTADWALAEEAWWDAEIDRLAAEHFTAVDDAGAILLRAPVLAALPLAVARRLVRRAMELAKGDLRAIDFGHIRSVMDLARSTEGHGRLQAPGLDIFRSFEWLRFGKLGGGLETRNYRLTLAVPGTVRVPGTNLTISLELIDKLAPSVSSDWVYNSQMGCLDWQRLSGSLELRNWRPGDQYQPVGYSGQEKIKTLFQQARIPLWERRHWPVLTDGPSIVWARRFGPAAALVAEQDAKVILRIREDAV